MVDYISKLVEENRYTEEVGKQYADSLCDVRPKGKGG